MNNDNDEILGIKGIPSENLSAGVGYVIIPDGEDRDKYIEDVYRSGKISIYGGYGHSNFYNIHIDREVLQRIQFPKKPNQYGSPVVWLNVPKHNEPIVISCLKYDETLHTLSEFRKRLTRSFNGSMVDVDLDAKKGKITISAKGNKEKRGEIEINLTSINNDGLLKLDINGEVLLRSTNRIVYVSENKIETAVTDKSGITKVFTRLNSAKDENRFEYKDEFENEITANKDLINIKDGKENEIELNETGISHVSKAISLGTKDGSKEPVTLGKTNTKLHQDHITELISEIDLIVKYCDTQSSITSALVWLSPLTPGYRVLSGALAGVKSKLQTLKENAPQTESKQNTTD